MMSHVENGCADVLWRLTGNDVHIWRVHLHAANNSANEELDVLSAAEQQRAARFVIDPPRHSFIRTRAALRNVLGNYLDRPSRDVIFHTGPHGKPMVAEAGISFNVSHAGEWALIAVTGTHAVGVDIEKISPARATGDIAGRFFSSAERDQLARLVDPARAAAFFRIWSRKEAVIKALGEGLSCPLTSFDVSADQHHARLLAFRRDGVRVADWSLFNLDAAPGYAAALAVIGPAGKIKGFDYQHREVYTGRGKAVDEVQPNHANNLA